MALVSPYGLTISDFDEDPEDFRRVCAFLAEVDSQRVKSDRVALERAGVTASALKRWNRNPRFRRALTQARARAESYRRPRRLSAAQRDQERIRALRAAGKSELGRDWTSQEMPDGTTLHLPPKPVRVPAPEAATAPERGVFDPNAVQDGETAQSALARLVGWVKGDS